MVCTRSWCLMISRDFVSLVSRNVEIGGGTVWAIRLISSSSITPGPPGICPTRPNAEAPFSTATFASSILLIQQIFTLGLAILFQVLGVLFTCKFAGKFNPGRYSGYGFLDRHYADNKQPALRTIAVIADHKYILIVPGTF